MQFVGDITRLGAKRYGEKRALTHQGRNLSYRKLDQVSNNVAQNLLETGIGLGDRIGIMSGNCLEYIVLFFAVAKCGAIFQTINPAYLGDELVHIVNDAEPKILFVGEQQIDRVDKCCQRFKAAPICVQLSGADRPGWSSYESFLSGSSDRQPEVAMTSGVAVALMYTSGTTGTPKGVLFSHRSLMGTFHSVIIEGDIGCNEIGLVNLPFFHAAGIFAVVAPLLMRGASLFIMSGSFDAEKTLGMVERHRVTLVMWVPTMLAMIVESENVQKFELSSLQKLYYGASPISSRVYNRARSIFHSGFYQFYGQTESGLVAVLRPEDHAERALCTGREMVNCEIRIVDDSGNDVPVGDVGEIISKSDNTMIGYLNNRQASDKAVREGWVYTGDLARVEEGRYFTVVGRAKDMIISGAENIYAKEVEEFISSHPAVSEVAVFGIPDEVYGESVCATIVLRPHKLVTANEIKQHCAERMTAYKKPKTIVFIDNLPKNATGKVMKNVLRQPYWKDYDRPL